MGDALIQFGLREHLTTVFRHRWKIVLVSFGAVAVAGTFAFLSTPVFVADTRMVILDQDPSQRVEGRSSGGELVLSAEQQVLTQVEIAASPQLVERAAERLGPERVIERMRYRWEWLRALPRRAVDRVLAAAAAFPPTGLLLELAGMTPEPSVPGPALEAARERIDAALFVDAIPKTDMFVIAVEGPDPAFAAEVVNTLVDVYVAHLAELRRPVQVAELAALEADRLQEELRVAEERARTYAERNGIVSIDAQQNLLLERVSTAETELAVARREQLEAERNIVFLRAEIETMPAQLRTSTVTRRNPAADQLLDRIATLEARAAQFVPGSPAASTIQGELSAVRSQLRGVAGEVSQAETTVANQTLENLRTKLVLEEAHARALEVRTAALQSEVTGLGDELRRLDGHEIAYRERVRQAEAKQQALRYALQRQEETRISERLSRVSLSRVVPVGPALMPTAPDRPRRKIILILGAAVGLAGGVGLAYALEFMRRTVTTREEAEAALGHPTVASFLKVRRRRTHERNLNRMECRNLINAVGDVRGRDRPITVIVASARALEGRSYVARRLGEELRDQGVSVLVIELEHAPATSAPASLDDATSHTDDGSGERLPVAGGGALDAVRFSGPPVETHARLTAMLDDLPDRHEVVIIDSLPVESCPEQLRVIGRLDSVVFVVEAERTPVFAARRSVQALEEAGARTLRVVLNKRRFLIPNWVYRQLLRPA